MEFLMAYGGMAIALFGAKSPFLNTRFHFLAVIISAVGAILFAGTIISTVDNFWLVWAFSIVYMGCLTALTFGTKYQGFVGQVLGLTLIIVCLIVAIFYSFGIRI